MKKLLFIFTLFIGFLTVQSQDTNLLDSNGERHGYWKKDFKNGRVRYQGTFDHGKEIGVFKFYSRVHSDQPIITKEFNTVDNKAIVKYYKYSGKIESEGAMQGKKRIGKWVYFHTDGKTIMQEEFYENGKLNGSYKTFFNNKKPTIITNYKNDKLSGNYKRYAVTGHLYQDLNYMDGMLNGEAIFYDKLTGEVQKKGTFKNDERVGTWSFNMDGEMVDVQEAFKPKVKRKH